MSCEIIIRSACAEDAVRRAELLQLGVLSHQWDAFIHFMFQELTLECILLGSAVLFIFCGASPAACVLVLPAAAALVALAVSLAHHSLLQSQIQRIPVELWGLVAEAKGLQCGAPAGRLVVHSALHQLAPRSGHAQLVGTLSVAEYSGALAGAGGWLHALSVHPQQRTRLVPEIHFISQNTTANSISFKWRRRGVARALVSAARGLAAQRGLQSLEALTSELQHPARALLHSLGWQCRGTYDRRLAGSALTLQLARLGLDLPHA